RALGHEQLLGHSAVAADAEDHRDARAADLVVAAQAELAAAAGRERLDRHRRPVVELAGELLARDAGHREAAVEHRDGRAADAAAAGPHARARAAARRGLREAA